MAVDIGRLIVRRDGRDWATLPLNSAVLTIGRAPDNSLTLPNPRVSRHHAELRLTPEGPVLTDLGSSNGTIVDAAPLVPQQPHLLTSGAVINIGPFELIFQAAFSAAVEGPLPPERNAEQEPPASRQEQVEEAPEPAAPPVPIEFPPPLPIAPPRPAVPAPRAEGPASRYLRDLPIIFQDNEFLSRFLLIFESIWEPLEDRQDHIAMYFNPATCPASFLPWLAGWLDLPISDHWPEARSRALLADAMDLFRWRGTNYGLTQMIEVCTGRSVHITDEPDQPWVIRVRVADAGNDAEDMELVEALIEAHKPAHVGYILESAR